MSICAARLTSEGFARFGTVVVADGAGRGRSVNQGRARRIPGIDDLSHDPAAGKPVLDIYSIEPSQLPFTASCLERHPLSSQVFIPVACARFLVVIAASDAAGQPDLTQVLAFIGDGTQIVHYRKGVWHATGIVEHRTGKWRAVEVLALHLDGPDRARTLGQNTIRHYVIERFEDRHRHVHAFGAW